MTDLVRSKIWKHCDFFNWSVVPEFSAYCTRKLKNVSV